MVEPGVVNYRLDDRLSFANVTCVKGRIREAVDGAPDPMRWVGFDAETVTQMDATGVAALGEVIDELKSGGIGFAAAGLKTPMRALFDDAKLTDRIGEDRLYPTARDAVSAVSICREDSTKPR